MLIKQVKRQRRHKKVRAKISGTSSRPRLCVFRSANHIYAQLINDEKNQTILSANDAELKKTKATKGEKSENPHAKKVALAYEVGKLIAQKAIAKGLKKVIFDRGGYQYQGRVSGLAEGARTGGLEF